MSTTILASTSLAASLTVLVLSAGQLVTGASRLGQLLRLSPVVVGALVVGFGTSLPELVVSALAVWRGDMDAAAGNITGSNVANLLLVLGTAALLAPTLVPSSVRRRELPASFMSVLAFALAMHAVSVWSAVTLALSSLLAVWFLISGGATEEPASEVYRMPLEILRTALSLGALVASSRLALESAFSLASIYGISSGAAGALLLAVGTSLPELAAALSAARRGSHGMIVGTLLGSNIMNSLMIGSVVVAVAASRDMEPSTVPALLSVQAMLVAVSVASLLILGGRLSRAKGSALLGLYAMFGFVVTIA